jgi:DNA ligase (NAD+)
MKKEIEIPTNCPSCDSELEAVNSQLFCRNSACPAQSSKKVEAFVKKMRIKGFGPATISKLGFVHPIELYETSLDDYVAVLGEKIGQKLYDEVQNSRTTTFATFLSALSIPLIGDTASKKIAASIQHLDENLDIMVHNWNNLDAGDKAKQNLDNWAMSEQYPDAVNLESYFSFKQQNYVVQTQNKGKVCITGKLKDFSNRSKAKEYLETLGYTVTSTVSSVTDYLVCEDGSNSSKSKKAESLGIPIVSIADLKGN